MPVMERPRIVLDLASNQRLGASLASGNVFVQDCVLPMESELDLVVQIADRAIAVDAKVVFVDPNDHGVGLELIGYCAEMRTWIIDFISGEPAYDEQPEHLAEGTVEELEAPATPGPDDGEPEIEIVTEAGSLDRLPTHPEGTGPNDKIDLGIDDDLSDIDRAIDAMNDDDATNTVDDLTQPAAMGSEPAIPVDSAQSEESRRVYRSIHERLRGLTLNEQIKSAGSNDINERTILERIYGKAVWEALLRNPRLTGPEVARISRMGTLPRPLLEVIMNNGGWLQIPEVRRALLASKRLGQDHVIKILRMLPKHELKLATVQTVYPSLVRDTARKLMREVER